MASSEEIRGLSREELLEILGDYQNSLDECDLATAVAEIGNKGKPSDIHALKIFLGHSDSRVRANAIEAIEAIGERQTIKVVIDLLDDSSKRVRTNVVKLILNKAEIDIDFLRRELSVCSECGAPLVCTGCDPDFSELTGKILELLGRLRDQSQRTLATSPKDPEKSSDVRKEFFEAVAGIDDDEIQQPAIEPDQETAEEVTSGDLSGKDSTVVAESEADVSDNRMEEPFPQEEDEQPKTEVAADTVEGSEDVESGDSVILGDLSGDAVPESNGQESGSSGDEDLDEVDRLLREVETQSMSDGAAILNDQESFAEAPVTLPDEPEDEPFSGTDSYNGGTDAEAHSASDILESIDDAGDRDIVPEIENEEKQSPDDLHDIAAEAEALFKKLV
ncbi:MAG: HEAT repeat domain-containing protein [Candidatus Wallbacteria bacterium]|nr:HEAT repeat domain-containing protein [Candidatus Wallbacteria bacterium]